MECSACGKLFPITDGMPHLYVDDESWTPKAREAEGWIEIHKQQGNYELGEENVDLKAPYYPEEPWPKIAHSFDMALSALQLTGKEKVLDLGAGRGWAAKQFALRGCQVVALDVVPDSNIGLGRARALIEDAGTYFERVIADGENLPFQPDTFDLVFCVGTLHHTSDLPLMIGNIHRVLKPGGRLCAINEPSISILDKEQEVLAKYAAHERELGINENRPSILGYLEALQQHRFNVIAAMPVQAYEMNLNQLRVWSIDLGAAWFRPKLNNLRLSLLSGIRSKRYVKNRLMALRNGAWRRARILSFTRERDQLAYQIMLWCPVELFLIAAKK